MSFIMTDAQWNERPYIDELMLPDWWNVIEGDRDTSYHSFNIPRERDERQMSRGNVNYLLFVAHRFIPSGPGGSEIGTLYRAHLFQGYRGGWSFLAQREGSDKFAVMAEALTFALSCAQTRRDPRHNEPSAVPAFSLTGVTTGRISSRGNA
jgi:hypothetical protein